MREVSIRVASAGVVPLVLVVRLVVEASLVITTRMMRTTSSSDCRATGGGSQPTLANTSPRHLRAGVERYARRAPDGASARTRTPKSLTHLTHTQQDVSAARLDSSAPAARSSTHFPTRMSPAQRVYLRGVQWTCRGRVADVRSLSSRGTAIVSESTGEYVLAWYHYRPRLVWHCGIVSESRASIGRERA